MTKQRQLSSKDSECSCLPENSDSDSSHSSQSSKSTSACESSSKSSSTCRSEKYFEPECSALSAREIIFKYKEAVVGIQSEFILLGGFTGAAQGVSGLTGDGFIGLTGGTPLGTYGPPVGASGPIHSRADIVLGGNGFFIKDHNIVVPAQLVLMPPSLTSVSNRWPVFDYNDITLGKIRNTMVRASRILVTVYNVNGKGDSYVYEADLVGVDGAGDVAVLRINYKKQWNYCNPCIEKCHPYFKFGKSRLAREGDKVYLLGDYISNSHFELRPNSQPLISEGLVGDYRYLDHSGWVLPETVLVSASSYSPSVGCPILNAQGRVIAMQTTTLSGTNFNFRNGQPSASPNGQGFVSGPSQFFMTRVIQALLSGNKYRNDHHHVQTVCDPAGTYYRYLKAYLGIAYEVLTGVDYDVTRDYTPGNPGAFTSRVRIGPSGEFLNTPSNKQILGLRVVGVAGANPNQLAGLTGAGHYVPGGTISVPTFLASGLPNSPLLGRIQPGDIITHINCIPLGDLGKQIAPSLITWRLTDCDLIELTYRRGGHASASEDNAFTDNYENVLTVSTCLSKYPPLMDYPWYAVDRFPLLSPELGGFDTYYPGFYFPSDQILIPQLPARKPESFSKDDAGEFEPINPGYFHPAF